MVELSYGALFLIGVAIVAVAVMSYDLGMAAVRRHVRHIADLELHAKAMKLCRRIDKTVKWMENIGWWMEKRQRIGETGWQTIRRIERRLDLARVKVSKDKKGFEDSRVEVDFFDQEPKAGEEKERERQLAVCREAFQQFEKSRAKLQKAEKAAKRIFQFKSRFDLAKRLHKHARKWPQDGWNGLHFQAYKYEDLELIKTKTEDFAEAIHLLDKCLKERHEEE